MFKRSPAPNPTDYIRHLNDPATFRRDGQRRSGIGRFIYRAGPHVLRFAKGVALGVVDGIPGVSQVVSTVTADKHVNNFAKAPRILMGWATVCVLGMTFAMKLTGHIDVATMLRIVLAVLGL